MTDEYLDKNRKYWDKEYVAGNVESHIFRPYGRIFKYEFGLDGSKNEKLLDFGCGEGAGCSFFSSKGFDVYGVDISECSINRCKGKMPDIADHFMIIDPKPKGDEIFYGGEYDIITAVQSLYYLSETDLEACLKSMYGQMKPGAILYATMMGTDCYYYNYSTEYKDGLRKVEFSRPRLEVKDYYVNFTCSSDDLINKFKLFKKCHVGYYSAQYREDEGAGFHWIFVGQKPYSS